MKSYDKHSFQGLVLQNLTTIRSKFHNDEYVEHLNNISVNVSTKQDKHVVSACTKLCCDKM